MSTTSPYASPAGTVSGARYISNTLVARLLMATLVTNGALDGLATLMQLLQLATDGSILQNTGFLLVSGFQAMGALLVLFANMILWLVWQYIAARNARALAAEDTYMEYGAGSGLLWWFVPFANLVKPLHVVQEIWTTTVVQLRNPELPSSGMLTAWWGLWVVSGITSNIALRVSGFDYSAVGAVIWMVASLLGLAAALAAALVVKRIDDVQVQVATEKALV